MVRDAGSRERRCVWMDLRLGLDVATWTCCVWSGFVESRQEVPLTQLLVLIKGRRRRLLLQFKFLKRIETMPFHAAVAWFCEEKNCSYLGSNLGAVEGCSCFDSVKRKKNAVVLISDVE